MSLLLDALKKAAQEKLEKQHESGRLNSEAAGENNPAASGQDGKFSAMPQVPDLSQYMPPGEEHDFSAGDDTLALEPLEEELHIDKDAFSENSGTGYGYRRSEVLASELRAFNDDTGSRNKVTGSGDYPGASETGQAMPDWSMEPLQTAYRSTPREAAQVFLSKTPDRSNRTLLFSLLMGIALLSVLAGMFVYHYFADTGKNLVVIKPESPPQPLTSGTAAPVTAEVDSALLIEQEDYISLLAEDLNRTAGDRQAASAGSVSSEEDQPVTAKAEPKPLASVGKPSPARKSMGEGQLKISKTGGKESLQDVLMRGYTAYHKGEFENAEVAYRQALSRATDNRDAVLGLAAIRLVQGDTQTAAAYYQKLLQRDPKDELALAALTGIQDTTGQTLPKTGISDESNLKLLLAGKPDSDYLHFALGNIFADERRWAEAQSAYFDAYRLEPANPDYAFNLAVSLDHLGKKDEAARYYRQSLRLARERKPNFDTQVAVARLTGLQ